MRGYNLRDDLSLRVTRAAAGSRAVIQRGRMFPNVRLLIAATFASVVVLICAIGLFAAFRVSHEPLVRVRIDTAPLPPLAGESAMQPLAFAAPEPFGRRFDLGEPQRTGEAADALTRWLARREGAETPSINPPAAPDQAATPDVKELGTVEAPKEAAAPASVLPPQEPTIKTANAPANDDGPAPAAAPAPPAAAAAVSAEAPAESSPAAIAEPAAALAPAEAPNVADIAPSADAIKPETDVTPAAVSKSPVDPEKSESAAAKSERLPHAARTHHRRASGTVAGQEPTAQQTTFATAPPSQQPQTAQGRAKVRHTRLAPAKSDDATPTGGPFVSAPGQ
jgi:hypothetical protein